MRRRPAARPRHVYMNRKHFLVAWVVFICMAHAGIRLYGIDAFGFENDESFTWLFSRTLDSAVIEPMMDVHPPGYYVTMSLWKDVWGTSEVSFRIPSVIFSLLTLVALLFHAHLGDPSSRTRWVIATSLLFCFLAYEAHLARHARSYTMLLFLCACFSYTYYRACLSREDRSMAPAVVCGTLALYTHHLAVIFIGASIAAGMISVHDRRGVRQGLTTGLLITALFLPWLLVIPFQMVFASALGSHGHFRSALGVWDYLNLLNPSSRGFFGPLTDSSPRMVLGFGIAIVLALSGVVHAVARWRHPLERALLIQVALMMGILIISPLPILNEKTVSILVPPAILLAGAAMAEATSRRYYGMGIIVLVIFVLLSLLNFPYRRIAPDWRSAYEYVAQVTAKDKSPVLVVTPAFRLLTYQYYVSRGVCDRALPVFGNLIHGACLANLSGGGLEMDLATDPGVRTKDGRLVRMDRAIWWLICKALSSREGVSDVYFLRFGAGNLLGKCRSTQGLPIRLVKHFGYLSLYHVGQKGHTWCTLFDPAYYLRENPDVTADGTAALSHFLWFGGYEGRRPHPLFDTKFYLETYPEVARSGMNPLAHFIEIGAGQGYRPNPNFDTAYYLGEYPDVAQSGMNPLEHFIKTGAACGYRTRP